MQNKILFIAVLILLVVYVTIDGSFDTTFFSSPKAINAKDTMKNTLEKINLEYYIIGVVAFEIPASFNKKTLKDQALHPVLMLCIKSKLLIKNMM